LTERARHILVAMDGAACEAVRGLKVEQDSDLALIWETLDRRFGYVDEPQRAMRRFDVRRQLEGETLAVFEQSLRMLHREAWPKTDLKSLEADSLLRRKFVDGIQDLDLQKYLRLQAATDDFATTVSKARHFMDASELARTAKKPAIRTTSSSVNYQTIVDGAMETLELHSQGRMTEVNAAQVTNPSANTGSRNKKPAPRQGSPVPSDTSAGSRASSIGRKVRFQDHGSQSSQSGSQAYSSSSRTRWSGNQSPQGNSNNPRPWNDRRQQGQKDPSLSAPVIGIWMDVSSGWSTFSAATVGRSMDIRTKRPTLLSPGPGKFRQLETGLAFVVKRS